MNNLNDLFDADGRVKTQNAPKSGRGTGKSISFESNANKFYGMDIRGQESPLIPPQSIIDGYQVDVNDEKLINTIKLWALGHPLFLIGETGCGKTALVKYMCASAKVPLFQVQGHGHLEWEDLVGRWVLEEDQSVFVPGPLVLALEQEACFLLDECASVKQNILNGLNELANGGDLVIDNARGHIVVKRKPGFRLVMTANPWDNYAGNNELNIAYLDRFKVRQFDYMTIEMEVELLTREYPTIPKAVINNLVKFARKTRSTKKKAPDSTRYIVATRTLKNICDEIVYLNCSPMEAVEDCVLSIVRLTAYDELKSIEEEAKQIISKEKLV